MNQKDFVAWAQSQHADGADETWEQAHFPLPKGQGDNTIPLHPLDHAIQGVFQSEEAGRMCFWAGNTRRALYKTPNYWPAGWFEACDLYEKWQSARGRSAGKKTFESKTGIHALTFEQRSAVGKLNSVPTRILNETLGIDLTLGSRTDALAKARELAPRHRDWLVIASNETLEEAKARKEAKRARGRPQLLFIEHLNGGGKFRWMTRDEGEAAGWVRYSSGSCYHRDQASGSEAGGGKP